MRCYFTVTNIWGTALLSCDELSPDVIHGLLDGVGYLWSSKSKAHNHIWIKWWAKKFWNPNPVKKWCLYRPFLGIYQWPTIIHWIVNTGMCYAQKLSKTLIRKCIVLVHFFLCWDGTLFQWVHWFTIVEKYIYVLQGTQCTEMDHHRWVHKCLSKRCAPYNKYLYQLLPTILFYYLHTSTYIYFTARLGY